MISLFNACNGSSRALAARSATATCERSVKSKACGSGTIDEKIYQRQLMKGQIANMMEGQGAGKGKKGGAGSGFSVEDLKELFKLRLDTPSDTHDLLCKGSASQGRSDTLTARPVESLWLPKPDYKLHCTPCGCGAKRVCSMSAELQNCCVRILVDWQYCYLVLLLASALLHRTLSVLHDKKLLLPCLGTSG